MLFSQYVIFCYLPSCGTRYFQIGLRYGAEIFSIWSYNLDLETQLKSRHKVLYLQCYYSVLMIFSCRPPEKWYKLLQILIIGLSTWAMNFILVQELDNINKIICAKFQKKKIIYL